MKLTIPIKPLSVNQAWQGKRFKTPQYNKYERDVLLCLTAKKMPEPPYVVTYNFYFSNKASDADNPVKCLNDILQKKYKFNDRDIWEMHIYKHIVPKGKEKSEIQIEALRPCE
jgi:Holliday junction resolvase RusA-like endonuclease